MESLSPHAPPTREPAAALRAPSIASRRAQAGLREPSAAEMLEGACLAAARGPGPLLFAAGCARAGLDAPFKERVRQSGLEVEAGDSQPRLQVLVALRSSGALPKDAR